MSERELKPGDVWGIVDEVDTWHVVEEIRGDGQIDVSDFCEAHDPIQPDEWEEWIGNGHLNITVALRQAQADAAAMERVRGVLRMLRQMANIPSPIHQSIAYALNEAIEGGA